MASEQLVTGISTINDLESSTFFQNYIISQEDFVSREVTIELGQNYQQLWLIIGNTENTNVDISIDIEISINNPGQTAVRIISLVFSAIFTLIFSFLSGYLWFEALVGDWYKKRILTDKLDSRLNEFVATSETWEQILLILGTIAMIGGITTLFIGGGNTVSIYVGLVLFILVYYNYNRRQKTQDTIKGIINQHKEISLNELAEIIQEQPKNTKKAVLDLIFYEQFPMTFDFQTEMITYHPERAAEVVAGENSQHVQESQFTVAQTQISSAQETDQRSSSVVLPECAYCGETALTSTALFCHSCGASISSAK